MFVNAVFFDSRMDITLTAQHGVCLLQLTVKNIFTYLSVEVIKMVKVYTRISLNHILDKFLVIGM